MAFPAGLTLVTVSGRFDELPDGGASGTVRFLYDGPLTGAVDHSIVPIVDETVSLDENGEFQVELPASNDPGWVPQDFSYVVTAKIRQVTRVGTLTLDYQDTSVSLDELIQWGGAAESGETYATLAQLQAHAADETDVHGIADTADLLTVDGGTITGSLTVEGVSSLDGGVAVEDRFSLSATGGMDWAPPGGANDTNLYRAGVGVLRTDYQFQAGSGAVVDGTASLGSKNGAGYAAIAGYLDISNAPTTGTWATGDVVLTNLGPMRCTAGGTPGTWALLGPVPAIEHGFCGWNFDSAMVQAGTILGTGGLSYIFRVRAMQSTVSAINVHLTVGGSALTNAFASLHDDSGLILSPTAITANQNTNLQTGGERTMPLGASQAVTPGKFYRVRLWATGTTLPTLSRACNSSSAVVNAGGAALWFASADSGLTDAASAPDQIGSMTGIATAWWVGLKA